MVDEYEMKEEYGYCGEKRDKRAHGIYYIMENNDIADIRNDDGETPRDMIGSEGMWRTLFRINLSYNGSKSNSEKGEYGRNGWSRKRENGGREYWYSEESRVFLDLWYY